MTQIGFGASARAGRSCRFGALQRALVAGPRSLLTALLMAGCGAAASPASPAASEVQAASMREAPPESDEPARQPASSAVGRNAPEQPSADRNAQEEPSADRNAQEEGVEAPPAREPVADAAMAPRDVLYRVGGPDGLVIEVEGVRLTPSAEVLQKPNGGYGVRLRVVVEELEDDAHILLVPKHGPLSMAATVFDAKGNLVAQHADVREGGDSVLLGPGATREFTREWPSGSVKGPLWWGRRLHLEVGLWGLGRSEADQRPVRRLFQVDVTANANPRAIVTPPKLN